MKRIFLVITLCLILYSCGGSASSNDIDPIVGQWAFYQVSVAHPSGAMSQYSPSSCFGMIEVKADGTYSLWNMCKQAMNGALTYEAGSGPWWKVSKNHYRANDSYDIIVDNTGNQAVFANMKTYGLSQGLYESGFLYKNVVITTDEMKW